MSHLFWQLHHPIIIDEHNFMDVFSVRRSNYTVEYEIKISKSDLMREIKIIKGEQPIKYSKDWTKWEKHAHYLSRSIKQIPNRYGFVTNNIDRAYFIPNEFIFYIPDFLVDCAMKELQGTPYGIIANGVFPNKWNNEFPDKYKVIKPAVKLHTEKATPDLITNIAHGLTIRNRLLKL